MAKFVALYSKPTDVDGFEQRYRSQHLPLVERWPRLQSWSLTRLEGTPRGGEPAYHLMFEATFASDEDLAGAMRSDEMMAAGKDAAEMCRSFGVEAVMMTGPSL